MIGEGLGAGGRVALRNYVDKEEADTLVALRTGLISGYLMLRERGGRLFLIEGVFLRAEWLLLRAGCKEGMSNVPAGEHCRQSLRVASPSPTRPVTISDQREKMGIKKWVSFCFGLIAHLATRAEQLPSRR